MSQRTDENILALDVGQARTGVALLRSDEIVPTKLPVIIMDNDAAKNVNELLERHSIGCLVVGYPRNMQGEPTRQSRLVEEFIDTLSLPVNTRVVWQDESLTSVKAEEMLQSQKKPYHKSDIDTLAASLILQDYIDSLRSIRTVA